MKLKASVFGIIASLLLLAVPMSASAQADIFDDACRGVTDSTVCSQDQNNNPISGDNGILISAMRILSFVVGVASVIMLIVGGIKYITSSGDANSITSAKNTILYALIGLVVFIFSQAIVIFVINRI